MVASPHHVIQPKFQYVPEWDDFLDLFPHRGSYLWAPHPKAGDRPEWNTEIKHLLSDRLIMQGGYLYGVRFGQSTNYLMIDIDRGSQLHPAKDEFAIRRLTDSLEPLGLVASVAIRSSYSDGIHLYFPFAHGQKSWAIAQAAESLIQSVGFKLQRGQIELFPNPRRCTGRDYNGHRLPLQQGSYLLNSDLEPVLSSRAEFVRRWRLAESKNTLTDETVTLTRKQFCRQAPRKLRFSSQKFLNDLNADIEPGWTGHGQSNQILGKIAIREYVFYHALYGGSPLAGERLAEQIYEVAEGLPGYKQFCSHQHDLVDRCLYWARCVEKSNYYPYGGDAALKIIRDSSQPNPWNTRQATDARSRIKAALDDLVQSDRFPSGIRNLLYAIKSYGIAATTFYKNRDLWEGLNKLKPAPSGMIHPVSDELSEPETLKPAPSGMIHPTLLISLYTLPFEAPPKGADQKVDLKAVRGAGGISTGTDEPEKSPGPVGIQYFLRSLAKIRERRRQPRPPVPDSPPPPDENWFNRHHDPGGLGC